MAAMVHVCEKCKTVYARADTTGGQGWAGMPRYSGSALCLKCHGDVVWMSEEEAKGGESFTARGALLRFVILAAIIGVCVFLIIHH